MLKKKRECWGHRRAKKKRGHVFVAGYFFSLLLENEQSGRCFWRTARNVHFLSFRSIEKSREGAKIARAQPFLGESVPDTSEAKFFYNRHIVYYNMGTLCCSKGYPHPFVHEALHQRFHLILRYRLNRLDCTLFARIFSIFVSEKFTI